MFDWVYNLWSNTAAVDTGDCKSSNEEKSKCESNSPINFAKESSVADICKKVHDNVIEQSKLDIYCSKVETLITFSFASIGYKEHDVYMSNLKNNIKSTLESTDWKCVIPDNDYGSLLETKIIVYLPHQSDIKPFM